MRIYYDGYHEGVWFRDLHPHLADAEMEPFPPANQQSPGLASVLAYDRPDIVLTADDDSPLLSLERTIEVPSGHNVGQRFARLAAAARVGVPAVYFGPYSAYKHGGVTRGPRYMNLRLFHAIDATMRVEGSPITTVRWPTDQDFEIGHATASFTLDVYGWVLPGMQAEAAAVFSRLMSIGDDAGAVVKDA